MMERSPERIIHANGVDLCVQSFGEVGDPAILLIMGSGASMDWWEDELCERLAAGGRFAVRYDHRDTGRSISYEPGAPAYTGRDLVADARSLIDVLGLGRAHLAGMSMGGAIAQLVALDEPHRVASLTLISTSPGGSDLPGMSEDTIAMFDVPAPVWSDRQAVIDHLVHLARVSAGRRLPFDEVTFRSVAARVVDRTTNIESAMTNHNRLDGDEEWRHRLGGLSTPTLVIHGTEDPIIPYEHGLALAREIPGARLLTLDRTGHELPRRDWDAVVPAILEQTAGRLSRM